MGAVITPRNCLTKCNFIPSSIYTTRLSPMQFYCKLKYTGCFPRKSISMVCIRCDEWWPWVDATRVSCIQRRVSRTNTRKALERPFLKWNFRVSSCKLFPLLLISIFVSSVCVNACYTANSANRVTRCLTIFTFWIFFFPVFTYLDF